MFPHLGLENFKKAQKYSITHAQCLIICHLYILAGMIGIPVVIWRSGQFMKQQLDRYDD